MNTPNPTAHQIAAEAEFQLLAATDMLNWLTALSSAIQIDHVHNRGKFAKYLAELAGFLSDTGFSGVESATEEFKKLQQSAPQNDQAPNRGAATESTQ